MGKRAAVLAFLNTALGLWLLSTVAVGIVSTGYTFLSAHLAENVRRTAQVNRLHLEVVQRDIQLSSQLNNILMSPEYNENFPDERIASAVLSYMSPPSSSRQARFPIYAAFDEYKDRPLISLLVEIAFLVGQKETAEWNLEPLLSLNQEKLKTMPAKEVIEILKVSMDSAYWKAWSNRF